MARDSGCRRASISGRSKLTSTTSAFKRALNAASTNVACFDSIATLICSLTLLRPDQRSSATLHPNRKDRASSVKRGLFYQAHRSRSRPTCQDHLPRLLPPICLMRQHRVFAFGPPSLIVSAGLSVAPAVCRNSAVIRLVVLIHGLSHFSDPAPVNTTAFQILIGDQIPGWPLLPFNECLKRPRLIHRQIGKHLAINLDPSLVQPPIICE